MKFILASFLSLIFFSCAQPTNKFPKHNDTLMLEAIYVVDGSTLTPIAGPVKRVIAPLDYIDSSSGKMVIEKRLDTFYLLPNKDTTLLVLDSAKRPILDKLGNKQYGTSFRFPLYLNKQFVHPLSITFPNIH